MSSSCMYEARETSKVNKRGRNGLHAYAWGCYSHICSRRFSQGLYIKKCGIQFHASFLYDKQLILLINEKMDQRRSNIPFDLC